MSEREKYAYRQLLYWTIVCVRNLGADYGRRSWNPLVWRRRYLCGRTAGALADWVHNLAYFSSHNFERFDTTRF